ncbi:MAG: DM13 domain-containing protein [Cyanobacteria bacterium P01_C01_bin.70]
MLTARFTLGGLTLLATLLVVACNPPSEPTAEPDTPASETVPAPEATEPEAVAPEADAEPSPEETAAEPEPTTTVRTGTFASAEHETIGGVELISDNGQQTLIFDNSFATSDGPDLVVVLHRSANVIAESTAPAYPLNEADYVVIAPLTSPTGAQEYVVPAEIDLSLFESVAVWCQAFNATFGAAPLQ